MFTVVVPVPTSYRPPETCRSPVTVTLPAAVVSPPDTSRAGNTPTTVALVPVISIFPIPALSPETGTSTLPLAVRSKLLKLSVEPDCIVKRAIETFPVSTGWFPPVTICTESVATGTPDGVQLPATFQSVLMDPFHTLLATTITAFAVNVAGVPTPDAVAVTVLAPAPGPSVSVERTRPAASVDVVLPPSEPPPPVTAQATACPPIGLPNASVTRATNAVPSVWVTPADCGGELPLSATIAEAAAATMLNSSVESAESPPAVARSRYPLATLRTFTVGNVAMPPTALTVRVPATPVSAPAFTAKPSVIAPVYPTSRLFSASRACTVIVGEIAAPATMLAAAAGPAVTTSLLTAAGVTLNVFDVAAARLPLVATIE